MRSLLPLLFSAVSCASTSGGDPPAPASSPLTADEPPPTRAAAPLQAPGAGQVIEIAAVRVTPIEATEGEDGRGALVAAAAPVAIDLDVLDGWPGRAREPELHVGQLVFRRYRHVSVQTLRFVVADRTVLRDAGPVSVRWGDDEATRVHARDRLVVP
jgi:hypothetical protein